MEGIKAVAMSQVESKPLWGYGHPWLEKEHWDELKERSLVVLDDIALRGRATDAQYDVMQKFLLRQQDRPTVITCNLDLDQIAAVYDDRTASRIAEGTIAHVGGDDRRAG